MISYRRVQKESDELLYTVWSAISCQRKWLKRFLLHLTNNASVYEASKIFSFVFRLSLIVVQLYLATVETKASKKKNKTGKSSRLQDCLRKTQNLERDNSPAEAGKNDELKKTFARTKITTATMHLQRRTRFVARTVGFLDGRKIRSAIDSCRASWQSDGEKKFSRTGYNQ